MENPYGFKTINEVAKRPATAHPFLHNVYEVLNIISKDNHPFSQKTEGSPYIKLRGLRHAPELAICVSFCKKN